MRTVCVSVKTAVDNSQQSGLQTSPYRSVDAQEETRWKKITITTGPTEEDLIMSVRHNVTSVQHAFNSGYDTIIVLVLTFVLCHSVTFVQQSQSTIRCGSQRDQRATRRNNGAIRGRDGVAGVIVSWE